MEALSVLPRAEGVPTQSGSDCCRRADALDVGQNLAAEAAAKKDAKPRVEWPKEEIV